jgi:hypothetical protein
MEAGIADQVWSLEEIAGSIGYPIGKLFWI